MQFFLYNPLNQRYLRPGGADAQNYPILLSLCLAHSGKYSLFPKKNLMFVNKIDILSYEAINYIDKNLKINSSFRRILG